MLYLVENGEWGSDNIRDLWGNLLEVILVGGTEKNIANIYIMDKQFHGDLK